MNSRISPTLSFENVTLGALIADLGPHTVSTLGHHDGSRIVTSTDFFDTFEDLDESPGTLLLAPSVSGIPTGTVSVLAERAAALGYAAIAIKCHANKAETYGAIAEASGIPFLLVSEKIGWRLFDALLAQLLGEQRSTDDAHRDRGAEPLFALANELAGAYGGSVTVEDLGRQIIAFSSVPGQLIDPLRTQGILTRRAEDSPLSDDQYRAVLRSADPIKYPQFGDEAPRIVCAIRAGTLPLGTIWAIDASGDAPLTQGQADRIQAAASIAASHMLDDLRVRRATQIPREDRLRTLLAGSDVTGSELTELGISEEIGATLLAFAPGDTQSHYSPAQLCSTVQRHLAPHRPEAVSVVRGSRAYALVSRDQSRSAVDIASSLLPVIDRLVGAGVRVAVPGVAHGAGEVAALRDLADRLIDTAAHHPKEVRDRVLTAESMRPFLLFERAAALFESSPELRSGAVDQLSRTDPRSAEALLAWCSAFGNIARAARELGVHENTIRNRLHRVEEQYGIRLDDADTLLGTWLQLRSVPGGGSTPRAARREVPLPGGHSS